MKPTCAGIGVWRRNRIAAAHHAIGAPRNFAVPAAHDWFAQLRPSVTHAAVEALQEPAYETAMACGL
jgi:hypothetical protein